MGNKYTQAQKEATIRYLKDKTDSIQIRVPSGTKARWKEAADARGTSMQRLIFETVERAISNKPEA